MLTLIIVLVVYIHIFFFLALLKKDFSIMDIGWGLGFIVVALVSYFKDPVHLKNALLLLTTAVWGLRLSLHVYFRNKGKPEDFRYADLRQKWGSHANREGYLKIFLFQGFLLFIVSLPLTFGMGTEMNALNWIGLYIWIAGFGFETYSDSYLKRYKTKSENKGTICMSGPWKYSRFPNYFGEILLWYGTYLISVSATNFWTIIGPITLNLLILKVTGVPFLEEKYRKRPEYLEYSRKVPRLVPFSPPAHLS